MKKVVFVYSTLVYIICFIPSLLSIFQLDFKFNTLFFLGYSSFSLVVMYYVFKGKYILFALNYLWVTNLLQAFSILVFNFAYRFLLGPSFSFSIFNTGDLITKFSFNIYNILFDLKIIKGDSSFLFNINVIQLFLFVYFSVQANKYKLDKRDSISNKV